MIMRNFFNQNDAMIERVARALARQHYITLMIQVGSDVLPSDLQYREDHYWPDYISAAEEVISVFYDWQDISTAPKDGTVIWARFRSDLSQHFGEHSAIWENCQLALRHFGIMEDGLDLGWSMACPVGNGSFPDEWIAGWLVLPSYTEIKNE